jgi:hypothetical protein
VKLERELGLPLPVKASRVRVKASREVLVEVLGGSLREV